MVIEAKIGLAMQLSQGQDRQPLSPEGAYPPAVRDARVRRAEAQKSSPVYVARVPVSTLFFVTLSNVIHLELSSRSLVRDTSWFLKGDMKASR